ncbi:MAG: 3-isopropylmalate dehydratase [Firmicutes bacterium]|nr:3-isopropylmalate dehydratase [Bacillota bacterium]
MKPSVMRGRVWLITNPETGKLIDNIDTDMIYHNRHLAVTEVAKMGQFSFGNMTGWEDFPKNAKEGDIVICGGNFGAGSSRQHAVDCFRALGIQLIIAESFGAIYKRNAINSGMPIVTWPGVKDAEISSGDEIEVELEKAAIRNLTTGKELPAITPFSTVQMDIYQAGDLFTYASTI